MARKLKAVGGMPLDPIQWGAFTGGVDNMPSQLTQAGVNILPPNFLQQADNFDINNEGFLSVRPGSGAAIVSGSGRHSGYASRDGRTALFVHDSTLYLLNADKTATALRSDLIPGFRMSYAEVNSRIYYTNNQVLAYVENFQNHELVPPTLTFKSTMLPGEMIEHWDGRLYTIKGGLIRWSDSMHFASTDKRRNYKRVPGRVTLFRGVKGGVYISFDGWTYFAQGGRLEKTDLIPLEHAQAIQWSDVNVNRYKSDNEAGNDIRWTSTAGLCRGLDGGVFKNLTSKHYLMPSDIVGAAGFYRESVKGFGQYISALQLGS
jgi:hypothetical protein